MGTMLAVVCVLLELQRLGVEGRKEGKKKKKELNSGPLVVNSNYMHILESINDF